MRLKHPFHLVVHALLILGSIFMLFPFVWMVTTSFKSEDEILKTGKRIVVLPDAWRPSFLNSEEDTRRIEAAAAQRRLWEDLQAGKPLPEGARKPAKPFETFDNYKLVWGEGESLWSFLGLASSPAAAPGAKKGQQDFYRYFLNTMFVSITITLSSLFTASLAAYAFAFFKFPLKDAIFMGLLGTMMLPQQALLIPNYILLSKLNWINTYAALIVPWVASVYSVFFLRQFFLQLPKDLFEAATIDGCTRFQFYWKVVLPLSKPPMVTLGIFTFLGTWNSFVWPLIVTNDAELRVIQVGLSYFNSEAGTQWGPLMAASCLTIFPLVVMYFLAQRQFVESQATTGMKE
ncbi:MAG: Carbohydrate ABC transport system, permease protein 2 [Candidatus Ozemobacter sibiricus]|jgi:multiple sugar transport system permease protein|uniref:Carbohydrate ABC transport system, permease protein 2 n=1 Tax=Candidatus Ozemobacter sibiricus TaxID=2268124 RepID=A0A367ZV37_9BACT|nr:MAG: Carbohydrate ABC transport system, permease protein 2 [Candidatus Ozemobacter sibiricus]